MFDIIDGHGGNHIYDTPKMIADRIINPQPGARIPKSSSLFLSSESADRLIKENLRQNGNLIDNWLANSKPGGDLKLIYTPSNGELTGFGIPRGGTNFMPMYKVTVILRTTKNGYRLHNFYPSF